MATKDDGKDLDAQKDTGWPIREGGLAVRRLNYRIRTNGCVYIVQQRSLWFFWIDLIRAASVDQAECYIREQVRRDQEQRGPWRTVYPRGYPPLVKPLPPPPPPPRRPA